MVSREQVEELWAHNVSNGVAMHGPMLWGYYFTNSNRWVLEQAIARLEELGYRYVTILHPDHDDSDRAYTLHVERTEVHSLESLVARCAELGALAADHDLGAFDGFDVGTVDGSVLD